MFVHTCDLCGKVVEGKDYRCVGIHGRSDQYRSVIVHIACDKPAELKAKYPEAKFAQRAPLAQEVV